MSVKKLVTLIKNFKYKEAITLIITENESINWNDNKFHNQIFLSPLYKISCKSIKDRYISPELANLVSAAKELTFLIEAKIEIAESKPALPSYTKKFYRSNSIG